MSPVLLFILYTISPSIYLITQATFSPETKPEHVRRETVLRYSVTEKQLTDIQLMPV